MPSPHVKLHAPDAAAPSPFLPMTVGQVLIWYAANNLRTDSSKEGDFERRRIWKLFTDDHGQRLCGDCRPADLLEWINAQKGVVSAWTRKRWAATINVPFNFATKAGIVDRNPFKGLRWPEWANGRDWTDAEYQTSLRSCSATMRRFIVLCRFSGMRPGEARGTEWPMVKMDAEAIIFDNHKTAWKTKVPRRVPFNRVLIALLAWLKRNNPPTAKKVVLNSYCRPWSRKALDKQMEAIRDRAGLDDGVTLHGCRHTFATRAVVNGVDIATLAQLLGHRSLATTQRYLHLAGKLQHLNDAMQQAVSGVCRH